MSEDYIKLIAKIQHFYEIMAVRRMKYEDACITCGGDLDEMQLKAALEEIKFLHQEYVKTFEHFLYEDPTE